ncbi:MAG: hypothetical protein H6732_08150 [Alphaproteobacteria bacterium]|nr:hypothetical protein [Alphaproteobacteria bacterium]
MILEPGARAGPPPATLLEATALELRRRRDLRGLVALVERWSQVGQPTDEAKLLQVEALLQLCMTDRAWTRLRSLTHLRGEQRLRARVLTAEMFLLRGWSDRAQEAIAEIRRLDPRAPALAELQERAGAPRTTPMVPESGAPTDELLAAAERFLCEGASLTARRLLEGLARREPEHPRVAELRWAMAGDFDLVGSTLAEVVERTVGSVGMPDLHLDPDLDVDAPTDAGVEIAPAVTGGRQDRHAFPSLFKGTQAEDDVDLDEVENTQAMRLDELASDGPTFADGGEDTQVMHVVQQAREPEPTPEPRRRRKEAELEDEDDVVVLVHGGASAPPPRLRRPLPSPAPQPRRKARPPPVVEPDELEPVGAPEAPRPRPMLDDDFPWVWVLASAAVLGCAGIALLLAVLVAGGAL